MAKHKLCGKNLLSAFQSQRASIGERSQARLHSQFVDDTALNSMSVTQPCRSPSPSAYISTPPSPSLTLLMSGVDMAGPETPPSYSSSHRGSSASPAVDLELMRTESPVLRGNSSPPGEMLDTDNFLKVNRCFSMEKKFI